MVRTRSRVQIPLSAPKEKTTLDWVVFSFSAGRSLRSATAPIAGRSQLRCSATSPTRWAFATALLGYISSFLLCFLFHINNPKIGLSFLFPLGVRNCVARQYLRPIFFDCKQIKCNEGVINNIYLQKRLSFTFERESFG